MLFFTECSFKLVKELKKRLDISGVVGTVLMDLSKAYDWLSNYLLILKLAAHGLGNTFLALYTGYLTNCLQRIKIRSTFSSYL